jgi:hypothetical protein
MILHARNESSPGIPSTMHRPHGPAKRRRWRPGPGVRTLGLGLLAVVATVTAPPLGRQAAAQDQATIEKLVQLNKKAMDDYDTAEFDAAKKALLDAEKLGKRSGLESHPVMARTFIHLGALYLVGYKDKQKAQHYFGKALDIQPDIKLDKNLTSSTVRDLFASVQGQKGGGGGGGGGGDALEESLFPSSKGAKGKKTEAPPPVEAAVAPDEAAKPKKARHGGEPDLPTEITALDCPYPDDTPPGKKVTLRCVAAPNLKVYKVALYYKGFEMKDYERVDMTKSSKGWEQATIPKKRVDGKSLQFYFEGLDESDRPVVSNGRAESPNVMLIVEGGSQVAGGGSDEEENPLEAEGRGPKLQLGKADNSRVGLDERFGNRRFWIGIGIGTGLVYAVNGKPESRTCGLPPCTSQPISVTGAGWAGLAHLVPEIGWHFNPDWAVSVAGRHQYILQDSTQKRYTASGAHAVLLKVRHFTKQNQLRFFYGVAGGGGEGARMNIISDPGGTTPGGMSYKPLKDTILVGGILLGAMGGVYYEVSKGVSLAFEVDALYAFPKTGLTVDGNALLQINFGDTSGKAEKERAKRKDSVAGSIDDEDPQ